MFPTEDIDTIFDDPDVDVDSLLQQGQAGTLALPGWCNMAEAPCIAMPAAVWSAMQPNVVPFLGAPSLSAHKPSTVITGMYFKSVSVVTVNNYQTRDFLCICSKQRHCRAHHQSKATRFLRRLCRTKYLACNPANTTQESHSKCSVSSRSVCR